VTLWKPGLVYGGSSMDPVALIVAALAAGNALMLPDGTCRAQVEAYAALRSLVRRRLDGHPQGAMLLARHADAPQTWAGPLGAALAAAGAARDDELVAAAAALLELAGSS
jgi:hypothetical protein